MAVARVFHPYHIYLHPMLTAIDLPIGNLQLIMLMFFTESHLPCVSFLVFDGTLSKLASLVTCATYSLGINIDLSPTPFISLPLSCYIIKVKGHNIRFKHVHCIYEIRIAHYEFAFKFEQMD